MELFFAGIRLHTEFPFTGCQAFEEQQPYHQQIDLALSEHPFSADHDLCCSHRDLLIYRSKDGWIYQTKDKQPVQLKVNADYSKLLAYVSGISNKKKQQEKLLHLVKTAIECRLAFSHMFSLHAACVELEGNAIAFTAPSGTGKSTRAEAWRSAFDARWISGDRPMIRVTEQGAFANGVPWDGKEQIFRQAALPLPVVCEVRRSPVVSVRRLSGRQAKNLLMQQCFMPMWDTPAAAEVMGTVYHLLEQIPVYRVFCGPDEDAAREVYKILFQEQNRIKECLLDMKIKEGFVLRNVVGENVVMPTGKQIDSFAGTLILSETAAFLWKELQQPISQEDLLAQLRSEYDVDQVTAETDLTELLDGLRGYDLLEE